MMIAGPSTNGAALRSPVTQHCCVGFDRATSVADPPAADAVDATEAVQDASQQLAPLMHLRWVLRATT